jgi:hypothetical protein
MFGKPHSVIDYLENLPVVAKGQSMMSDSATQARLMQTG